MSPFISGVTAVALFHLSAVKRSLEEEMKVKVSGAAVMEQQFGSQRDLDVFAQTAIRVNSSKGRKKIGTNS